MADNVQTRLGRIEGKLDTFIEQMRVQDSRTTDIEVRTRKVENRQHWYSVTGGLIGVLVGKFAPGIFGHS